MKSHQLIEPRRRRTIVTPAIRRGTRVFASAALAVSAAGLLAAPASAAPITKTGADTVSGSIARHDVASGDMAAAHTFWTADRMRRAKAADVPATGAPATAKAASTGTAAASSMAAGKATTASAAGYVPTAQPPSHGEAQVGVTSTVGRAFFTDSNGTLLSCSASTVTSLSQNMVMTTGDCVYGGPGFANYGGPARNYYTNWIYFPGISVNADGTWRAPYGGWAAQSLFTTIGWQVTADQNEDVGIAIVETHEGKHLVQKVGGNGLTMDQPRGTVVHAYGYSGTGFNASLSSCTDAMGTDIATPPTYEYIVCDFGPAGAGGPWLMNQDLWGVGYILGLNPNPYVGVPSPWVMYSPYFSTTVVNLYLATRSL